MSPLQATTTSDAEFAIEYNEPQVVGRTENLGPVREALLGWRAGEPPEPVQRLDETKELSPLGLVGCSVPLSTEGVGTVGSIPA